METSLKACLETLASGELGKLNVEFNETSSITTELEVELIHKTIEESLTKYNELKKTNSEDAQKVFKLYESLKTVLKSCMSRKDHKLMRTSIFKVLIQVLPLEMEFVSEKPHFPDQKYAEIVGFVINGDDSSRLIEVLKDYTSHEDMNINLWKAIDIASSECKLDAPSVKNILNLISIFVKVNPNIERPKNYFCRTKLGVLNAKKMSVCARAIWERIILIDFPVRTRQLLLVTLLEKIMPIMDKPIFLTDYFMSSLEFGGAITLLSLQGIFELIQKHNINYPNIYGKLYEMFKPEIFETSYKARFYYLADLFLSSLHLPEALVAGFVKRVARLALIAPPNDIIILMAFVVNLIIRHPTLSRLVTNMKSIQYDSDPYLENEKDPSESKAIESSLWEVFVLQNHILPSVSHSAIFINDTFPTVEIDLSSLLEVTLDDVFDKEMKKKLKDPPLSFEKPTPIFLSNEKYKQGFVNWDFSQ